MSDFKKFNPVLTANAQEDHKSGKKCSSVTPSKKPSPVSPYGWEVLDGTSPANKDRTGIINQSAALVALSPAHFSKIPSLRERSRQIQNRLGKLREAQALAAARAKGGDGMLHQERHAKTGSSRERYGLSSPAEGFLLVSPTGMSVSDAMQSPDPVKPTRTQSSRLG